MPDISIRWVKRGDKARSPANPAYPAGVVVDVTNGQKPFCTMPLLYPARCVGTWFLTCNICGLTAAVTAAGRADDPREVRLACKAVR
jgi:hypothetical protein